MRGLTAFVARLALPAWSHMSSDADADTKNPAAAGNMHPYPVSVIPTPYQPAAT